MFNNLFVQPLYNLLVFILNNVPFADLGVAVVILTVIVRSVLYPISKSAIRSQIKMKKIQGQMKEIQAKYKDDKSKQAQVLMELYRENNIKPFSGFLLILIQLPIMIGLYFVFSNEGLPEIKADMLYSFIQTPEAISSKMFGFIDIFSKSILLACTAAFAQFMQFRIMFSKNEQLKTEEERNKKIDPNNMMDSMAKNMQTQMKYFLPVMIFFASYSLGAVIGLYFTVSNVFSIFQEIRIKNKLIKENNA